MFQVHERTHRNDRPFECNICLQRFYRKEPMQKHQWRQHGVVHFKTRPTNTATNNNINNNNSQPSLGIIGAEGILYHSLTESIKEVNSGDWSQAEIKFEEIKNPENTQIYEPDQDQVQVHIQVQDEDSREEFILLQNVPPILPEEKFEVPEPVEETVVHTTDSETLVQITEPETTVHTADLIDHEESFKPIKLKMKLAQAYMKEIEENREREERYDQGREGRDRSDLSPSVCRIDYNLGEFRLSSSDSNSTSNIESNPNSRPESRLPFLQADLKVPDLFSCPPDVADSQDSLEFLCKACGTTCLVSDPYSFSCPVCNIKYTSMPTNMIADPLQCIGCMELFPHKPALKQHQSSEEKERPFKCCKCGFGFRQKAHLQKHQWRIHRKRFEAEPNVRVAEALLSAVDGVPVVTQEPELQIDPSTMVYTAEQNVPKDYSRRTELEPAPLDLSPTKMYGTPGSITKWVEQVETARTPIIPDISIMKKAPTEAMSRFQELLSRPVRKEQVQLQIINSLSGRREEPLIIHLGENNSETNSKPFAIKTKIPEQVLNNSWKNMEQANNPLLNQIMQEPQKPSQILNSSLAPAVYISRASKRPRTDPILQTESNPSVNLTRAIPSQNNNAERSGLLEKDFLIRPNLANSPDSVATRLQSPLSLNTTPLRLDTPYSTVSPPLNLTHPQVSPYDYRIGKSNLISGHFQRLKSQDDRSGI